MIDRLGTVICKKVNQFGQQIGRSRLAFLTTTDTFIRSSGTEIPKELEQILSNYQASTCRNQHARNNLIKLYRTGKEKFNTIYHGNIFNNYSFISCDKEFIEAIDKLSVKELKVGIEELQKLYSPMPLEKVPSNGIAKLLILRVNNPETYNYLINHPDKKFARTVIAKLDNLNGSAFETLTVPQIKQIMHMGSTPVKDNELWCEGRIAIGDYVYSSDSFVQDKGKCETLRKYLSQSVITEPFTAFRGERDTGMFESIKLDDKLALKTKWYVLKNMLKAKKVTVHDYTGNYETSFAQKLNLFDFIMGKKELTLADAMQVAKYGDKEYQQQIIALIKESKIQDNRFKSLTFDRQMARGWVGGGAGNSCRNTGIVQHMSVERGLEGMYSPETNRQAEFILNNNPKTISFQDVVYDEAKDIFEIRSTITNAKNI